MSNQKINITIDDVKAELERRKYNKIDYWFPDTGPFARENYKKHIKFLEDSATNRECALMAANRIGKSECAAYAVSCHLTGRYPKWWTGRVFNKPINWLVAGETGKLVRDSIQLKLLGPPNDIGSGMIPKDCIIGKPRPKAGTPDAVDVVYIRHKTGGQSLLQFQSYDQGRTAFQATERDGIELDEEPPLDIYSECLIRTMTTNGLVLSTFTPLKGVSETVLALQDKAEKGLCSLTIATWDDAPHLTEKDKADLMASLPPHQRDARTKGVPALGSGAVFQISEADISCNPFEIPKHFKRLYGFDVGWNNTACAWGAYDAEADVIYVTHTYKRGQAEPATHAQAIKERGDWILGAIDPASRGRAQADGEQLIALYRGQGLNLILADNAVEAGIFDMYERMATGRLKVFSTCFEFFAEYRLYRRDEKGKIVKQNDHVMDAARYMVRSIIGAGVVNVKREDPYAKANKRVGWMG